MVGPSLVEPPSALAPWPRIPASSWPAYHRSLALLTEEVGRDLESRDDLGTLLGGHASDLLWSIHKYHSELMDTVLCLGSQNLLVRSLAWTYRVGCARGFSPDVFPVVFAAWQAAIRLRIPAPLAEPILELYAWMILQHPVFLAHAGGPQARAGLAADLEPLLEELLAGDFLAADRRVMGLQGEHPGLQGLYLEVLAPIMEEIGLRWETARITEAQEHLASALVMRMMSVSYAQTRLEPQPDRRVLVCCGPQELHQIGAWMVADFLELAGWDVRLLGADTAIPGLLDLIGAFRPHLLILSVAMPIHLRQSRQLIEQVRQHPAAGGLRIMVGGQAFRMAPELTQAMGADGSAADARGAVRLAQQWLEEAGLGR